MSEQLENIKNSIEKIKNKGIGKTINDRLKKASNFK